MRNILHIIPTLNKGGAERLVLDICNELQKREGVKVKLVVLHPENEYEFLSKNIDIQICGSKVIPSISGASHVDISAFEKTVTDFKPNIIHSHLFEAELVSRWHIYKGIKYITHCHDNMRQFKGLSYKTLFNKKLLTDFYEKKILTKQYKKCDNNFIVISKDTDKYFRKNLPESMKANMILLNNAIDFNRFANKEKKKISLNKKKINLVTVGSLTKSKNQLFLIDVANSLNKKDNVLFKLIIIGEGVMRGSIESKILEYQLQNSICLTGLADRVEDFLKEADLYIYSCVKEGFGLTLIEAMAAGLPVVCLDGKGNRDIIEQGKNGFMIFEQNPEIFAEKIIDLVNNADRYSEMSMYANEFAKKFDIKDYVDKLVRIYRTDVFRGKEN